MICKYFSNQLYYKGNKTVCPQGMQFFLGQVGRGKDIVCVYLRASAVKLKGSTLSMPRCKMAHYQNTYKEHQKLRRPEYRIGTHRIDKTADKNSRSAAPLLDRHFLFPGAVKCRKENRLGA